MKKRCTNSSCRKEFIVGDSLDSTCPHCGKKYPRLPADAKVSGKCALVLLSRGYSRLCMMKAIRRMTGLGVRDVKTLADHCPSLLAGSVSAKTAYYWMDQIQKAGGQAIVLPASRVKKSGAFVIQK